MRQIYGYHPVVGYRFVPNLKVRIPHEGGGYLMQINESGFRSNRPFVKERTKGSSRVLFLATHSRRAMRSLTPSVSLTCSKQKFPAPKSTTSACPHPVPTSSI